jgi:hypothetical protein
MRSKAAQRSNESERGVCGPHHIYWDLFNDFARSYVLFGKIKQRYLTTQYQLNIILVYPTNIMTPGLQYAFSNMEDHSRLFLS